MPYFELKKEDTDFPPAFFSDQDGLLAVGGDMTEARLLKAYHSGVFYWHHPMKHIKWWSPDPRIVFFPDSVQLPVSVPGASFRAEVARHPESLLRLCQQHYNLPEQMGPAWLSERMVRIFTSLHARGLLHVQEVWQGTELVGGFFGVRLGEICFGEYAVAAMPGADTYAILHAARALSGAGVRLMDMQKETARCSVLEYDAISRVDYLDRCRFNEAQSPA